MTYRDAAGDAPDPPDAPLPVQMVKYHEHTFRVRPHGFGRWSCPYCGAWRWWPWPTDSKHGVGAALPHAAGEAIYHLKRECQTCDAVWFVETLEGG